MTGVDAHERLQWSYRPVGAERQRGSGVEQRAEIVRIVNALGAQALLRPAAIVDSMIGLHGGDHVQLSEAWNVRSAQMLRVLNA